MAGNGEISSNNNANVDADNFLAESRAEKGKIRSEEGKKLSLKEIAEVVRNSKEDREKLKNEIAKDLIAALKSEKGFKIVHGDRLSYLNTLLPKGYRINFNENSNVFIHEGDYVSLKENGEVWLEDNHNKTQIGTEKNAGAEVKKNRYVGDAVEWNGGKEVTVKGGDTLGRLAENANVKVQPKDWLPGANNIDKGDKVIFDTNTGKVIIKRKKDDFKSAEVVGNFEASGSSEQVQDLKQTAEVIKTPVIKTTQVNENNTSVDGKKVKEGNTEGKKTEKVQNGDGILGALNSFGNEADITPTVVVNNNDNTTETVVVKSKGEDKKEDDGTNSKSTSNVSSIFGGKNPNDVLINQKLGNINNLFDIDAQTFETNGQMSVPEGTEQEKSILFRQEYADILGLDTDKSHILTEGDIAKIVAASSESATTETSEVQNIPVKSNEVSFLSKVGKGAIFVADVIIWPFKTVGLIVAYPFVKIIEYFKNKPKKEEVEKKTEEIKIEEGNKTEVDSGAEKTTITVGEETNNDTTEQSNDKTQEPVVETVVTPEPSTDNTTKTEEIINKPEVVEEKIIDLSEEEKTPPGDSNEKSTAPEGKKVVVTPSQETTQKIDVGDNLKGSFDKPVDFNKVEGTKGAFGEQNDFNKVQGTQGVFNDIKIPDQNVNEEPVIPKESQSSTQVKEIKQVKEGTNDGKTNGGDKDKDPFGKNNFDNVGGASGAFE